MKREALDHPKMKKLARLLGVRMHAAVGMMEMLWHFTAKYCPHGDIGKIEDEDIALALDFEGDSAALIDALVRSKWVERCSKNRLLIHDWSEFAEPNIHCKLAMAGEKFADGTEPKLSRLNPHQKAKLEFSQNSVNNVARNSAKSRNVALAEQEQEQSSGKCKAEQKSKSARGAARARSLPADAGSSAFDPIAHELAELIEQHPDARDEKPHRLKRRAAISRRIKADGEEFVSEAIRWIFSSDDPDAKFLAAKLAKFPGDVLPGPEGQDKLEQAHRLIADEIRAAEPPPPPSPQPPEDIPAQPSEEFRRMHAEVRAKSEALAARKAAEKRNRDRILGIGPEEPEPMREPGEASIVQQRGR